MLFYSVVVIVLYARRLLTLSVNLMIHLSTAPGIRIVPFYTVVRKDRSLARLLYATGHELYSLVDL